MLLIEADRQGVNRGSIVRSNWPDAVFRRWRRVASRRVISQAAKVLLDALLIKLGRGEFESNQRWNVRPAGCVLPPNLQ